MKIQSTTQWKTGWRFYYGTGRGTLAAHELARSWMADRQESTFVPFTKGDQVWLDSRNLKTIYHKKMKPKWEGPFLITEVLGLVTYRLQLPAAWRIHNVFHATLLVFVSPVLRPTQDQDRTRKRPEKTGPVVLVFHFQNRKTAKRPVLKDRFTLLRTGLW